VCVPCASVSVPCVPCATMSVPYGCACKLKLRGREHAFKARCLEVQEAHSNAYIVLNVHVRPPFAKRKHFAHDAVPHGPVQGSVAKLQYAWGE
jgi:hypothetical protein